MALNQILYVCYYRMASRHFTWPLKRITWTLCDTFWRMVATRARPQRSVISCLCSWPALCFCFDTHEILSWSYLEWWPSILASNSNTPATTNQVNICLVLIYVLSYCRMVSLLWPLLCSRVIIRWCLFSWNMTPKVKFVSLHFTSRPVRTTPSLLLCCSRTTIMLMSSLRWERTDMGFFILDFIKFYKYAWA